MYFNYRKTIINFFSLLFLAVSISCIAQPQGQLMKNLDHFLLTQFYNHEKIPESARLTLNYIKKEDLPAPYDFLLTQPIMTMGITQYYQRTPKVRTPLYVTFDAQQKLYSRAIIMIIDHSKDRNDALHADKQGESTIVELGLITINFNAIPQAITDAVLHTQTPFGTLLAENHLKTHNIDRKYFNIKCSKTLAKYLQCPINKTLYGRVNTLIRDDNDQWVAHVVEILT